MVDVFDDDEVVSFSDLFQFFSCTTDQYDVADTDGGIFLFFVPSNEFPGF